MFEDTLLANFDETVLKNGSLRMCEANSGEAVPNTGDLKTCKINCGEAVLINMSRNPLKKCSWLKVIFLVVTGIFCWSIFTLINTMPAQNHFKWTIANSTLISTEYSEIKRTFFKNLHLLSAGSQTYLYQDLIKENPLGTYFSDRLGGSVPFGKSHLELIRRNKRKLLKSVLIFAWNISQPSIAAFGEFFARQRIEYRFRSVFKTLPPLVIEDFGMPRYSLIVFDDYATYANMEFSRRDFLDNYCKTYKIGMLVLTREYEDKEIFSEQFLFVKRHFNLRNYKLNQESDIWRVAKSGQVYLEPLPSSDWAIFITKHETYRPLVFSSVSEVQRNGGNSSMFDCVVAVHDLGLIDGIQRIILGHNLDFFLNSIVATDAITYLTNGLLGLPLTRHLQVDIDDIFVGDSGIRTLVKDARALVTSQQKIREHVPGFTYNLGFSGEFYMKGNMEEQAGDRELVALAHHFLWFNHLFRHDRLLNYNSQRIKLTMDRNDQFAQEHNLPLAHGYHVPPFHAGVYPVYELLYDEWTVRGVSSTSTTQYPKLFPMWGRRGFIYRDIMVLPRMDCNLFTFVNKFEDFPGGKSGLDKSIKDNLFKMFLHIPVLIFMSHMSNFANDQLGQYTFDNVVQFVTTWTNLQLESAPPEEIARRYFEMYPTEATPVWTYVGGQCGPNGLEYVFLTIRCADAEVVDSTPTPVSQTKRLLVLDLGTKLLVPLKPEWVHLMARDTGIKNPCEYNSRNVDLLPPHVICSKFPKFFVVGPESSGISTLQRFLEFHPNMMSIGVNVINSGNADFFSGDTYRKGLDWYQKQIPYPTTTNKLLFETSSSYFADDDAPKRIHDLIPKAKIVILLSNPVIGAFACYQKSRLQEKYLNQSLTFVNTHSDGETTRKFQTDIRITCLQPRAYAIHLARWLQFFSTDQVLIIDTDQLFNDPSPVLYKLQTFLNVFPLMDLASKERYNLKNRCFYQADNNCLKPPTDETYNMIDDQSMHFLQTYFMDHNSNLKILLTDIEQPLPDWLSV